MAMTPQEAIDTLKITIAGEEYDVLKKLLKGDD